MGHVVFPMTRYIPNLKKFNKLEILQAVDQFIDLFVGSVCLFACLSVCVIICKITPG